jgi:hypothetical protein
LLEPLRHDDEVLADVEWLACAEQEIGAGLLQELPASARASVQHQDGIRAVGRQDPECPILQPQIEIAAPTEPPDGEKIAVLTPMTSICAPLSSLTVTAITGKRGTRHALAIPAIQRELTLAPPLLRQPSAQPNVWKIVAPIHLQQCQIGAQISPHYLGRISSAIFGSYCE